MSRSPVRVSEPPRPRTQGAAAWMLLPTLGRSRTRIGRCQATPYSAEIRDGAARLAELRLRAVRRAARQRRGRRRARSPTRACPRSRRRTRGRGAMRARTAVPRRGPGGRGARARPGGRGDRRARRPPRHGRCADPKTYPAKGQGPALDRCPSSVPDLGRRGAISAGATRPDGRSGQRAASLARSQPKWAGTGRKSEPQAGPPPPRNPWNKRYSGLASARIAPRR